MANYETLKSAIQQVVKTNGNNEITGALLQQSLLAMVNSLGQHYQFAGIATPSTNPGTPDQNIFYLAGPGTYSNFNSLVVQTGNLGALCYNGVWTLQSVQVGKDYDTDLFKMAVKTTGFEMSGIARNGIALKITSEDFDEINNFSILLQSGAIRVYYLYVKYSGASGFTVWENYKQFFPGVEYSINSNNPIVALRIYVGGSDVTGNGDVNVSIVSGILYELNNLLAETSNIQNDVDSLKENVFDLNSKIGKNTFDNVSFDASYTLWTVQNGKVVATTSSYANQKITQPIAVKSGDVVNITQSILGTGRKAIFADSDNNVISHVPYTGSVVNYVVPDDATQLYINRAQNTDFSCTIQSAESAKFEQLISGTVTDKQTLPIYPPMPQLAADGQNSTIDAENSTSDQVFEKCDSAIADYPNYANGEILGKDATGTYDIKRYTLCRSNLFAWKAAGPYYAWVTNGNIRYIKSCSPYIGNQIFDSSRNTVISTVASFDCTTGIMTDANGASYTRQKTSDIAADIIYTQRQTFTFSFDIFTRSGSVITRLVTSAWDSTNNTISYNSKLYYRSRVDDWGTDKKATIVIWGNEHAAQSDPHECSVICYRLIRDLCQNGPSTNKFLSFLKNYCKVIILPIVNPYGYNNYAINKNTGGRLNGNGVNLNRNYPTTGWVAGSAGMNYGGTYGGSEIETQYVINTCIEFMANVGIDIHCLGYTTEANENTCAYGGNFADKSDVNIVVQSMLSDFNINLINYGDSSATGDGEGKNWLLANQIEGGLIEMNAGDYSLTFNGNQHTGVTLAADYALLLRMLNLWNNRFSNKMNLINFEIGL